MLVRKSKDMAGCMRMLGGVYATKMMSTIYHEAGGVSVGGNCAGDGSV